MRQLYFGSFGSSTVFVGPFGQCLSNSTAYTQTQVICSMPPGTGTVTVRVRDSTTSKTGPTVSFTYDPPNIDLLQPTSIPTQGAVNITLTGSNFGDRRLNDTALVLTVAGTVLSAATILEHTHTVLTLPLCLSLCSVLLCSALRSFVRVMKWMKY